MFIFWRTHESLSWAHWEPFFSLILFFKGNLPVYISLSSGLQYLTLFLLSCYDGFSFFNSWKSAVFSFCFTVSERDQRSFDLDGYLAFWLIFHSFSKNRPEWGQALLPSHLCNAKVCGGFIEKNQAGISARISVHRQLGYGGGIYLLAWITSWNRFQPFSYNSNGRWIHEMCPSS